MTIAAEDRSDFVDRVVFNDQGLVPVVAQSEATGLVLMLAWMNREALTQTLDTGQATYWSRSRQELWVKGETSGNRQTVKSVSVDCDGDSILLQVDQQGPACHTGLDSCFDTASVEIEQAENNSGEGSSNA